MEEEGGYDFVEAAVEDAAVGAAPSGQRDPSTPANSLADAVSEEYVAAQTDANVDRAYAYLPRRAGDAESPSRPDRSGRTSRRASSANSGTPRSRTFSARATPNSTARSTHRR